MFFMILPMLNPKISVLAPTYNEAENIGPLITAILKETPYETEVIVIDDNSPDETWRVAQEMAKKDPRIQVERRLKDRGLTKSIRRGIELSKGDIIVWLDCDFSMPPAVIPVLIKEITENENDIAVGSRFVKGGKQKSTDNTDEESALAIFFSTFGCTVMRLLLFPSFHDYTSGFIAIKREVLERIPLRGDYGEYFIDLIVRAKLLKYAIVEIPYTCEKRMAGESKTAPTTALLLKRIRQYSVQILKMELVRLRFFFTKK
ncbi:polyprenol monophosphomannose synthase [Candidatus Peregrinibacteria bacterium CG10_big_fil_rev_8_21_14_0_10_42_8]|nr:MAG: polyprenol monophosphomannose synthase [Candidatus Peregrinibacteria bacterium CG10_big_fil_rev_8_21_14_0_10_42_8]